MSNVVQFKRKPVTESVMEPKQTKWDEAYAAGDDLPQYKLVALMMGMSWAYQTGQGPLGDKFLLEAQKAGFAPWVMLGKELGDAIERADLKIAMYGTPEQSEE